MKRQLKIFLISLILAIVGALAIITVAHASRGLIIEVYPSATGSVHAVWNPRASMGDMRTVTAYSELDSCHYENCIMANGERAYIGAVACPRMLKLGSSVEIDGKVYVCADRTAKRYDGRYDVFMGYNQEGYDRAIKFGKQELQVIIK